MFQTNMKALSTIDQCHQETRIFCGKGSVLCMLNFVHTCSDLEQADGQIPLLRALGQGGVAP